MWSKSSRLAYARPILFEQCGIHLSKIQKMRGVSEVVYNVPEQDE